MIWFSLLVHSLREFSVSPCLSPCSYTVTANAFSALLLPAQVRKLQQHPSVAYIRRDTIVRPHTMYSPTFINVKGSVWPAVGGQSNAGEGIVIGIIDSGIWPEHPSFSDVSQSFRIDGHLCGIRPKTGLHNRL